MHERVQLEIAYISVGWISPQQRLPGWWHGAVGNASRMRRSYSMPFPV